MRPANIFLKHGLVALTFAIGAALPALAQDTQIEFGDNASEWAEDGECDDARFTGEGMAFQPTEAEIMHDATDCEAAFNAGTITLKPASEMAVSFSVRLPGTDTVAIEVFMPLPPKSPHATPRDRAEYR